MPVIEEKLSEVDPSIHSEDEKRSEFYKAAAKPWGEMGGDDALLEVLESFEGKRDGFGLNRVFVDELANSPAVMRDFEHFLARIKQSPLYRSAYDLICKTDRGRLFDEWMGQQRIDKQTKEVGPSDKIAA